MTTYQINGIVEDVGQTAAFGASGFMKRTVVINTALKDAKYPNPIALTLKKEKCALADSLRVGDEVNATVTIDGRKWDGPNGVKYFIDLTTWKLAVVQYDAPEAEAAAEAESAPTMSAPDQDELPF